MGPDLPNSGEIYVAKLGKSLPFRLMRTADLQQVVTLEQQLFRTPWSAEMFREDVEQDYTLALVVMENQTIVAYVITYLVADEMHIANVGVAPEYQRLGIGYKLIYSILRSGRERGYALAHLEVRKSNDAAIALYLRLGFDPVGIRKNYYEQEQEDAVLMSCLLQTNPILSADDEEKH